MCIVIGKKARSILCNVIYIYHIAHNMKKQHISVQEFEHQELYVTASQEWLVAVRVIIIN